MVKTKVLIFSGGPYDRSTMSDKIVSDEYHKIEGLVLSLSLGMGVIMVVLSMSTVLIAQCDRITIWIRNKLSYVMSWQWVRS